MKLSKLVEIINEVLHELNEQSATNVGGASFTPGKGAQYATPKAFGKVNLDILKKFGYKEVKKKKKPYHTKTVDYLDENTTGKI